MKERVRCGGNDSGPRNTRSWFGSEWEIGRIGEGVVGDVLSLKVR
jgi:hypothetical protein